MEIINIKGNLHDEHISTIISLSIYMPTKEKLSSHINIYESDANIYAFAYNDNGIIYGTIILRHIANNEFEILNIATDPAHRNQGVASKLINFAVEKLKCKVIKAETDENAVEFYRKYGFHLDSLGEKYPNCIRYLCTLKIL